MHFSCRPSLHRLWNRGKTSFLTEVKSVIYYSVYIIYHYFPLIKIIEENRGIVDIEL